MLNINLAGNLLFPILRNLITQYTLSVEDFFIDIFRRRILLEIY